MDKQRLLRGHNIMKYSRKTNEVNGILANVKDIRKKMTTIVTALPFFIYIFIPSNESHASL